MRMYHSSYWITQPISIHYVPTSEYAGKSISVFKLRIVYSRAYFDRWCSIAWHFMYTHHFNRGTLQTGRIHSTASNLSRFVPLTTNTQLRMPHSEYMSYLATPGRCATLHMRLCWGLLLYQLCDLRDSERHTIYTIYAYI